MKKFKLHFPSLTGAMLYTLMAGQVAIADDTEVLIGSGGGDWPSPNILFIMDTSGSMATVDDADADSRSRLKIVQDVFAELMTEYSEPDSRLKFNVAMMRFDSTDDTNSNNTGGSFVTPMQLLDSNTKDSIITASNALTTGAHTPLAETLYEAALFYRGETVHFGNLATPNNVTTVLNPADDTKYLSPISYQCQANSIILLTDGEPTGDTEADTLIETLADTSCSGNCLDELAGYLNTADHSSLAGKQKVKTYTIGFTTNQTLLEDAAKKGGGSYMTASNATQLKSAFERALGRGVIEDTNNSFSPPAMAANAFNNISHTNKLYFTLFEPAIESSWVGNVKPYKLTGNPPQLTDANSTAAVHDQGILKGMFKDSSVSFWSAGDAADGGSIGAGGANSQLPSDTDDRKLYTYTGTSSALTDNSNALKDSTGNSALTPAMLELTSTVNSNTAINAARERKLNDPLHSKPVLVSYGGTEENPKITLFVATNGGFLHAINAGADATLAEGEERFAFMPNELLPNLDILANNSGAHPYGLDGDVTAWVNDINGDASISGDDHVYVYVGMRRGGNNYYALDVTNPNAPTLKWVIKGGGGLEGTTGFSELGQSWSRPTVTTIKDDSADSGTRTVLIFGGGYDTAQDANPVNAADTIGRAIFIVDADTGAKLWQADSTVISSMTNSIPSDVKLVDSDFDGHTDRLYVGDMDGQVFRIDLNSTLADSTGVLLADLGSKTDTDAINNRRFYYPPDVVMTQPQQPGAEPYVSVNIGSGYRSHPLNSIANGAVRVDDRFYSLRDPNFFSTAPDNFTAIIHKDSDNGGTGNLFDLTIIPALDGDNISDLADSDGWYIKLGGGNGEKVLAPSITLNGEIFFTTYTPPTSAISDDCKVQPGAGTLYRVSLFNAAPPVSLDADGEIIVATIADRTAKKLSQKGIPSSPTILFREKSDGDVELIHCEGTECEELPNSIQMEETYWRD